MQKYLLISVGIIVLALLVLLSAFSGTIARPYLELTPTPAYFSFLPMVARNWQPTPIATPTATTTATCTPTGTPTATFTPTPTKTPTVEILHPLPELHVNGSYIERVDTGEQILLKGGASTLFYWDRQTPFTAAISVLETELIQANMNYFRASFSVPEILSPQLYQDLDKLIDYTERRGMYVILDPHHIHFEGPPLPNDEVVQAMQFLADRYKERKHVMYGLYNEPHDTTWEEWMPWATRIASAIREKNPNSILLLSGIMWSRDFRYLQDHPFPFNNTIMSVHDYYWGGGEDSRNWWKWMIGIYPVMLTEFGGLPPGCPYQSPCDIAYMQDSLQIVNGNPNKVGYTFHPFEHLIDDSAVTPWGSVILPDLANYPPTSFR